MIRVTYTRKSVPEQEFELEIEFPVPKTAKDQTALNKHIREVEDIPSRERLIVTKIEKVKAVQEGLGSRSTSTARQDYEQRKKVEGRQVQPLPEVTWMDLFDYVGERITLKWLQELSIPDVTDTVDPEILIRRYFHCEGGGLLAFLSEAFPYSTSISEFCQDQVISIKSMENVILHGGVQQCLEPRAYAKALALDTNVPTVLGDKPISQIKVGDQVFDKDGKVCNVIRVTKVFQDQECFRVRFDDGESITCCGDHLWLISDADYCGKQLSLKEAGKKNRKVKGQQNSQRVLCTSRMFTRGVFRQQGRARKTRNGWSKSTRFGVKVCGPLQYEDKTLPIDPYVLGCWLGDGTSLKGNITACQSDALEYAKEFNDRLYQLIETEEKKKGKARNYKIVGLVEDLRKNELLGDKHIPQVYFSGGVPQRLELLQGLMDTDGSITKNGHQCTFTNKNMGLAEGVYKLAASLGFKPTISDFIGCCVYKGERVYGQYWKVSFKSFSDMPVFKLRRKVSRLTEKTSRQFSASKRIVGIDRVPSVPVKCIEVDSPDHTFLCGEKFTTTHNSARVSRAALWAVLGGYRHFPLCFQSSKTKARDNLERVQTELIANKVLQAMFPMLVACCKHAENNNKAVQEIDGNPTYIQWQVDEMRLPDIMQPDGTLAVYSGAFLKALPFGKATGTSIVDPRTGQDRRPDLILADDVQDQDNASSPVNTAALLNVYYGSIRYLNGRTKETATFFMQTIFEPEDMADTLRKDPSIQTIRYSAVKVMPDNMDWWRDVYRPIMFGYNQGDEESQLAARKEANEIYLANREIADQGAVVAWEYAFDPSKCHSALQSLMNNYLTDEKSFWTQDQNTPVAVDHDGDIRCPASVIVNKIIKGIPRRVVPANQEHIVCHIDCQDDLLYWMVASGTSQMGMHVMDYQTWPKQSSTDFQLRHATIRFTTDPRYRDLPTVQDRLFAALRDLIDHLREQKYYDEQGDPRKIDRFGIDESDGDHRLTVHNVCKHFKSQLVEVHPMKGWAPSVGQTSMSEKKLDKHVKYGDEWIRHPDKNFGVPWIQANVTYYKKRLHEGLKAPVGTSMCVSLFDNEGSLLIHKMLADHCNSEVPTWISVHKLTSRVDGFYKWTQKVGQDNHRFDNAVGCKVLINYSGASYVGMPTPKKKQVVVKVDTATAWENHPELYR